MKLKGPTVLLRTIICQVECQDKIYEITLQENITENEFKIFEVDEEGSLEEEISPDSALGEKLIEFFLIETEDIEQFL